MAVHPVSYTHLPRRYDLAKVGRYKFNKKLALKNRISGQVLAEDVVDPSDVYKRQPLLYRHT